MKDMKDMKELKELKEPSSMRGSKENNEKTKEFKLIDDKQVDKSYKATWISSMFSVHRNWLKKDDNSFRSLNKLKIN
jgi:hypothetical protein